RILARRFIRRQRRVSIKTPANANRRLWSEQNGVALVPRQLAQRRDVIQDPKAPSVGSDRQIVVLNNKITNGCGRHVKPQRLPIIAVIYGNLDLACGSTDHQSLALVTLPHKVAVLPLAIPRTNS